MKTSIISLCLILFGGSALVCAKKQDRSLSRMERSTGSGSILNLFSLALSAAVPLVLGESLEGPNLAQRSFGSMARAWGLEECGQLAICDAHARYDDYGVLALPLVLMFPGGLDEEGEPDSLYQAAAIKGKAREECTSEYSCLVNPLTVAKFLMKIFMN